MRLTDLVSGRGLAYGRRRTAMVKCSRGLHARRSDWAPRAQIPASGRRHRHPASPHGGHRGRSVDSTWTSQAAWPTKACRAQRERGGSGRRLSNRTPRAHGSSADTSERMTCRDMDTLGRRSSMHGQISGTENGECEEDALTSTALAES